MDKFTVNPEKKIKKEIKEMVQNDLDNKLFHLNGDKIFSEPIIGFADGRDQIFTEYKNIIGDFHKTPAEWLNTAGKDSYENISVICWILPISKKTRKSNTKQQKIPSERWAHTRNCGEKFNNKLRKFVVSLLKRNGYQAIAPMLSDKFEWKNTEKSGIASTWSERHAMYAAGLGTFGLCDGLITKAGKAMRCGSVITSMELKASERNFKNHSEYCLFLEDGKCGKCIKRCPGNAITQEGHSKEKCLEYQRENIDPARYGEDMEVVGCGLCQTDVPCEGQLP